MEGFKEFFHHQETGYSDQETISLYLNNPEKRIKEITALTGKSVGELYRTFHSYNVKPNRLKTNHHNVLNFAAAGLPISQIAELTGYTERNVRIILGKYV